MNAKILLVDDHPMFRDGLRQAICRQPKLSILAEASTGAAALKLAAASPPDLVVMDVHLPDMSGLKVAREILQILPAAKIIILSGDASRPLVEEALQAGACGYIWKQGAAEELMRAIELVLAGKLYLSPEVSTDILADYRKGLAGEAVGFRLSLSQREGELLKLVAEGRRNKEIADELAISVKSVEACRSRLMKKLNCTSAAELVRYAIREGIVAA